MQRHRRLLPAIKKKTRLFSGGGSFHFFCLENYRPVSLLCKRMTTTRFKRRTRPFFLFVFDVLDNIILPLQLKYILFLLISQGFFQHVRKACGPAEKAAPRSVRPPALFHQDIRQQNAGDDGHAEEVFSVPFSEMPFIACPEMRAGGTGCARKDGYVEIRKAVRFDRAE
jgi:hypothetical protein